MRARAAEVGPRALSVSIITVAELHYGAACSAKPDANHAAVEDFISPLTILGVDAATVRTFAELKSVLRMQGMLIEDFDLLIASAARTYGLKLVTNNVAHFSRIPGLELESWT